MNEYQRAVKEVTDRRREDLDEGVSVWRAALAANPELAAANAEYQEQAIKKAQGQENSLDSARTQLAMCAKRAGITQSTVEPPFRCTLCGDTGYVNGKYCKCVVNRVIRSNSQNLVLPHTDFYSAKETAPKAISKVYTQAEAYIKEFPACIKPFFIIAGSPGTGKTVLASAIATELMSRGASAVTVSAFDFVKRAKDYHTQFAIDDYVDLFSPMLECDVLVIDDLGTETMLKNVTREYFYTVINERYLRKKNTVITTNLSPNELLSRYGEAVFSRFYNKINSSVFIISASNARIK